MHRGDLCICGQVFKQASRMNGYFYAQQHLFAEANGWMSRLLNSTGGGELERAEAVAVALGFLEDRCVSFEALQEEWLRRLAEERAEP